MNSVGHYAPSFRIMVQGRDLSHGVTADVLSVSVTETFNRADSFSIVLRETYPEPGRLFAGGDEFKWMDSGLLDESNEVEIYLGYVDDLHLMLRGEISALNPNFPASGEPTLTVQGYSLYQRLQHRRRREPFKSATDSGIVEEIAAAMNLKAVVDRTEAEHPLFSPQGDTLAHILTQRAQRLNYEVTVKDRTLYFQRPRYLDNPSPGITLEWGKDLISFSPRLSIHNAATEVTVRGPQTSQGRGKDPLVGTARAGDVRVKMGAETGQEIAKSKFGDHHVLVSDHNVANAQEANEMALARLEDQALEFIGGRGSCIGNPKLSSRMVIELKGLGKRFTGNYYITSTTHSIGSGGYRTDFEVKRNAR
ncbi:MAG: hypothetical protein P8075_21600 [Deltaproteobacteria bacterium]|jgi:phage protein D